MSEANGLMSIYISEYMEKVFYFCLRKTGNSHHAQDLVQEISLCVLQELRRGIVPDNYPAWVWQIARNRYAKWADAKHRKSENETGTDIEDFVLADSSSLENEYIHQEDLAILRRELAFISSEYRNVLVAYYIDNNSVNDIAQNLKLPVGTVKSKLFRARNILKEGMNMAREFGELSYKPENVSFYLDITENGQCGEPFSITSRKLYKNILLAAYRTPSTASELSIELGVALPYTEDLLEYLADVKMIKKTGNKYEACISIISKEAQKEIYLDRQNMIKELTCTLIDALEYKTKCFDTHGIKWHGGYQTYENMKWALLMLEASNIKHTIYNNMYESQCISRTDRGLAGTWDLLGFEEFNIKNSNGDVIEIPYVCHQAAQKHIGQYLFPQIEEKQPTMWTSNEENALLSLISTGKCDMTNDEKNNLLSYGYIRKTDNGIIPAITVLYKNASDLLQENEKTEYFKLLERATAIARTHFDFCKNIVIKEIPQYMTSNERMIFYNVNKLFELNGGVYDEAVKAGYLTYNDGETEARDRALGAYIVI